MKVASKDRKESLEVLDFRAFCSKYNLDERVKEEVATANFENKGIKPGKDRSAMLMTGATLGYNDEALRAKTKRCNIYHEKSANGNGSQDIYVTKHFQELRQAAQAS